MGQKDRDRLATWFHTVGDMIAAGDVEDVAGIVCTAKANEQVCATAGEPLRMVGALTMMAQRLGAASQVGDADGGVVQ